jgi:hypothetical protein
MVISVGEERKEIPLKSMPIKVMQFLPAKIAPVFSCNFEKKPLLLLSYHIFCVVFLLHFSNFIATKMFST